MSNLIYLVQWPGKNCLCVIMTTNFLELATTLKYLGAEWLPEKKLILHSGSHCNQKTADVQYFQVVGILCLIHLFMTVVLSASSGGQSWRRTPCTTPWPRKAPLSCYWPHKHCIGEYDPARCWESVWFASQSKEVERFSTLTIRQVGHVNFSN